MTTLALGVVDAAGERVGGEAAEDHRVRGADAGAGQHRDHGLGDHRHVDRDPVAGLDAELGQRVGGLADLVLELGVGDGAGVAGLALPVEATLSPWPASTCRSTQLYATLSLPPTNHLANGGSSSRGPRSHGWSQVSRSACSSQKRQPVGGGLVVRVGRDVGVRGELAPGARSGAPRAAGWPGSRWTRSRCSRLSSPSGDVFLCTASRASTPATTVCWHPAGRSRCSRAGRLRRRSESSARPPSRTRRRSATGPPARRTPPRPRGPCA